MTERLVLCIPDAHIPHHDPAALGAVLAAIDYLDPDEVLILGDWIDCHAPARWSKATAAEFAATLPGELAAGKEALRTVREHHSRKLTYIIGNHEQRIHNYTRNYAPALIGVVPSLDELLGFAEFEVEHIAQPYEMAPGVLAIHGNKLSSTQNAAGQSAFKERMRHGASIVQGHSHRAGLVPDTQGSRDFFSMECGHLVNVSAMDYLDFPGVANWQQGFGTVHVLNGKAFPSLHLIHDGVTSIAGVRLGSEELAAA